MKKMADAFTAWLRNVIIKTKEKLGDAYDPCKGRGYLDL